MSGCPCNVRAGHATALHFHEALCQHLPRADRRSTCQNLCLWPVIDRRTQKHRIDCLSFWPVSPAASRLHWLGCVGRCALARGVAGSSQEALGTRRWRVGVRSFRVSQIRSGVGGSSKAVVWSPGKSRSLPSGHLRGICLPQGAHPGRHPAVSAESLDKAGVPKASRASRTRHQLALEMLAAHSASLPQRWMAGDDEMGRPYWCRRRLAALDERSLLAVPSHTAIRDLETPLPEYRGKGRRPGRSWHSVQAWSQALDATAWRRLDVRDGANGPLVVEIVKRRVVSRTHRRQQGDEELLAVMRYRDRDQDQVVKVDYSLYNAVPETPLGELARVAKAEHRIEACLQRSKSEAGLADYEVRHWTGWQQH